MCSTCGCSDNAKPRLVDVQNGKSTAIGSAMDDDRLHAGHKTAHEHVHQHAHNGHHHEHSQSEHHHGHSHPQPSSSTIRLEADILSKNNRLAERNRGWFAGRNIFALNLMSSPGAGKTTLLERTIQDLGRETTLAVIEGDQETTQDAERIRAAGCRVVQINTGTGCHLDAVMVADALKQLDPPMNSVVFIENVGNLVCPALFDLGEESKVVIMSVTEGDDKPLKYPHIFHTSDVMILNKIDLLPYVPFSVDRCLEYVRRANPRIRVFPTSALSGEGLDAWYAWLQSRVLPMAVAKSPAE